MIGPSPLELVRSALAASQAQPDRVGAAQIVHQDRSRRFVEALGAQLRALYADQPDVRVLTKHHDAHRDELGMNELLYDVHAVRVATVPSASRGTPLTYVTASLWQVESELARDSRQALFDFNKLVAGAADHKLFVGPRVADPEAFRDVLAPPASHCSGSVSVCLIPPPRDWPDVTEVTGWAYASGVWRSY